MDEEVNLLFENWREHLTEGAFYVNIEKLLAREEG